MPPCENTITPKLIKLISHHLLLRETKVTFVSFSAFVIRKMDNTGRNIRQ